MSARSAAAAPSKEAAAAASANAAPATSAAAASAQPSLSHAASTQRTGAAASAGKRSTGADQQSTVSSPSSLSGRKRTAAAAGDSSASADAAAASDAHSSNRDQSAPSQAKKQRGDASKSDSFSSAAAVTALSVSFDALPAPSLHPAAASCASATSCAPQAPPLFLSRSASVAPHSAAVAPHDSVVVHVEATQAEATEQSNSTRGKSVSSDATQPPMHANSTSLVHVAPPILSSTPPSFIVGLLRPNLLLLYALLSWWLVVIVYALISPRLQVKSSSWLNALVVSTVVGSALVANGWPSDRCSLRAHCASAPFASLRLFLIPFCVSSYSAIAAQNPAAFRWMMPMETKLVAPLVCGVGIEVTLLWVIGRWVRCRTHEQRRSRPVAHTATSELQLPIPASISPC